MFGSFHPLLLEAHEHGIPLFDRGGFAAMHEVFLSWRRNGLVEPLPAGWRFAESPLAEAEPG
jgi:hypothetical protein